jgi:hypothetical protein
MERNNVENLFIGISLIHNRSFVNDSIICGFSSETTGSCYDYKFYDQDNPINPYKKSFYQRIQNNSLNTSQEESFLPLGINETIFHSISNSQKLPNYQRFQYVYINKNYTPLFNNQTMFREFNKERQNNITVHAFYGFKNDIDTVFPENIVNFIIII